MNMRNVLICTALLVLATGCAGLQNSHQSPAPVSSSDHERVQVATRSPSSPGSLWTQRKGGLFNDVKAREVGDIVTVAIFEKASATKEATTETGRDSSTSASISKILGLEKDLANAHRAIDPTALLSASFSNDFKGAGTTSRKEDLVATLTTEVIEVLPNGNLRISGGKTVKVNNEDQIIRLSGMVRPNDIGPENVVDSKYVLNANIDYTGSGVLSDKQKPGWATRIIDNIWPF